MPSDHLTSERMEALRGQWQDRSLAEEVKRRLERVLASV